MKLSRPPFDIATCRAEARAARRAVGAAARAAADAAICRAVASLVAASAAQRVASYLATDGEVDMAVFHDWADSAGIEVWLPAVTDTGVMEFRRHRSGGPLISGPLGTRHPPPPPSSDGLDVVDRAIVPVVAFDDDCNGVGGGGGYYDRALAPLADRPAPFSVGVAFEVQRVDGLAPEAHDAPLDRVITEAKEYQRR